ncbi:MAG TPA: TadE/TadG family type IV pilus assembly protein [Actinomycetes bacterium]
MGRGSASLRALGADGAAAVEFVLILPILLLLLFGIISFGWVFSAQLTVNNAVREGARAAVVAGGGIDRQCNTVVANVRAAAAGTLGVVNRQNLINVTVTRSDGSNACGTGANPRSTSVPCTNSLDSSNGENASLIVKATYPAEFILPLGLGPTITLSSKAVYRCEFS